MTHRYAIDSLVIRNDRCFGWGWFLDDTQSALQCELRLALASGLEHVLVCVPGGMREDLRNAFPAVPHAPGAGFMMQGKLPGRLAINASATLVATLRDGSLRYCEVPGNAIVFSDERDGWIKTWKSRLGHLRQRVRDEGFREFAKRVVARLREDDFAAVLGRALSRQPLALAWRLRRYRGRIALVFDHAMGGGAHKFRNHLVNRLVAQGHPVLVVVPQLSALQYEVTLYTKGRSFQHMVDSLASLLVKWQQLAKLDIHVNELVSFESPLDVLDWCRARRASGDCELTFYVHDFHAACPAWTLVSVDGRFCNVPGLDVCRRCLPVNYSNTLGFSAGVELPEWRESWGGFLLDCDRIVAFSSASVEILRRAYPRLADERISIQPHAIDVSGLRPVVANPGPPLVIAVAGSISVAKGANMLRDMAAIIRADQLAMRIVVFGTLEHHDATDDIEVHGKYAPQDLPGLLEHHGASICLLPSICAETFSFVTAEYMAMGMPVAVFPIGAPAERVAAYDQGLVISRVDAATAVAEIARFVGQPAGQAWARP